MGIENRTKEFFSFLFPERAEIERTSDTSYQTNEIMLRALMVYGGQSSGKTETVRKIGEMAVKKYGEENVSVFFSEGGDIDALMDSLDNKLVNIVFADNLTLVKLKDETVLKYMRARNIWAEKFNRRTGLFIGIIGTHNFTTSASSKPLRTNLDAVIWKTAPMNLYDRSVARRFISEEAVQVLEDLDDKKLKDRSLKGISVYNIKTHVGYLITPLAKKNYLQKIDKSKADIVSELKALLQEEDEEFERGESINEATAG
jgi:hypothetical protein